MNRKKATLIGALSVAFWGTLPVVTSYLVKTIPPFQVMFIAFSISALAGFGYLRAKREALLPVFTQNWKIALLGVYGITGFHYFYFDAFKSAPPIESYLIINLWPLMMIIFSVIFLKQKMTWLGVAGAILAFSGVVLIVTKGKALSFSAENFSSYLSAFASAFIWASYSVICNKIKGITDQSIVNFCLSTAIIGGACHLLLDSSSAPVSAFQWLLIFYMATGPLCAAFFTWDYGMKHGDIKMIGTLSYMGPLIGTTLFTLLGFAEWSFLILISCLMIIGGSALSARGR